MKPFIFIGLWCLAMVAMPAGKAFGQYTQLIAAEYFWNTDPGAGNGTPVDAADGNFNSAFEQLIKNGISLPAGSGVHALYVRVRGTDGIWSPAFKTMVSIESLLTARDLKITQAEYYWNNDPGAGSGSPLLAFDGNFNDAFEQVVANGVGTPGNGVHKLSIRVKGLDGAWSPAFSTMVSVESLLSARDLRITQAEYFWNSDPGEGSGTAMLAFDGNFNSAFEQAIANGAATPGTGLHKLSIRVRGLDGDWSPAFSTMVSVEDLVSARDIKITSAEYFWNTDPGTGNGTPLLAFDGNFNDAFEVAFANGVTAPGNGLHTLNVRYAGLDGTWSNVFKTIVSVEEVVAARDIKITSAEYFWNTDPGTGNGTPLLAFDGNFNDAFEVAFANNANTPGNGLHTLNVRYRGLDGAWSNAFRTIVSVETLLTARDIKITSAEYFWNTDPGQGSGTPLLAFDGNFNDAFEVAFANNANTPGMGLHALNVRFLGLDGAWSNVFTTMVSVESLLTARDIRVIQQEFFFDTDPGEGNGTPLFVVESAFTTGTGTINSAVLTPGQHILHVRTRGLDGAWSNVFRTALYVDPCLTSPDVVALPAGPLNLCPGSSLELFSQNSHTEFQWYKGAGLIGNDSLLVVTEPGFYYLVGLDEEGCAGVSEGVWVNAISVPSLAISPAGPIELCDGQSVNLSAVGGPFISFLWSTGQSGNVINVNTADEYTVTGTHSSGCQVTSAPVTVNVNSAPPVPTISADGPTTFCIGGSVVLTSSYATGNLWSTGATTQSITVSTGGNYWVTYTSGENCSATSAVTTVTVGNPSAPISQSGLVEVCDGNTLILWTNFLAGHSYEWFKDGVGGQAFNAQIAITQPGTYWFVVTDPNGCQATSASAQVVFLALPTATIMPLGPTTFCSGGSVELQASAGSSWSWNTGANTQTITANVAGNYWVTVTGTNGCQATSTPVTITLTSPLTSVSVDNYVFYLPNATANFSSSTTGNIVSYDWDFGDGGSDNIANPSHTYSDAGFYTASLEVEDDGGCKGELNLPGIIEVWEVWLTENASLPVTENALNSTWLSPLTGWVTLPDGTLCVTTDGGLTWNPWITGANVPFYTVLSYGNATGNTIWIAGADGTVCYSINGGPWVISNPPGLTPGTTFYGGTFVSPGFGYFLGSNNTICVYDALNPNDGGWTAINPPLGNGVTSSTIWYGGYWLGGNFYAVGSGGLICVYTGGGGAGSGGGGGTWSPVGVGGGGFGGTNFYGVFYSAGTNCAFAVGSGGAVYGTFNGGGFWSPFPTGYGYNLYGVCVYGSTVVAVGQGGTVLVSLDGGNTWELYSIGTSEDCTGVEIIDCVAYITTNNGGVYRFLIPGYVEPAPVILGPASVEICTGDPAVDFEVDNPKANATYTWSNATQGYSISTATAGIYTVGISYYCGTATSAGVELVVNNCAPPCLSDLSATVDNYIFYLPNATANFNSSASDAINGYDWDFGDTNSSTDANPSHEYILPGFYTVSLTAEGDDNCTNSVNVPGTIEVWQVFNTEDVSLPVPDDALNSTWLSPETGYVTLPNGTLCYTINGGISWSAVTTGLGVPWYYVNSYGYAGNYYTWIAGGGGNVCYSYNGGPWVATNPGGLPAGTNFYGGTFYAPGFGYFVGSNNTVCWYNNGTWVGINPPIGGGVTESTIWRGCYYRNGYLYIVGTGGLICYYFNGQWYPAGDPIADFDGTDFNNVTYSEGTNCAFAVGNNGRIYASFNGGTTWVPRPCPLLYHWYDVAIIGNTIICVGQNGAVAVSTNEGLDWELSNIGTYEDCLSIRIRECVAYITTRSGGVYRYLIPNYIMPPPVIIGAATVETCEEDGPYTFEVFEPQLNATYLWSNSVTGTQMSTDQSGFYTVQKTNFCGTATSLPVQLIVDDCEPCFGDLNGDNIVNFNDLSILLTLFGQTCSGSPCPGDFNGDLVISFSDLSILLANYGSICP